MIGLPSYDELFFLNPKGPYTKIVYTLGTKYLYRDYFMYYLGTWTHRVIQAFSHGFCVCVRTHVWVYIYIYIDIFICSCVMYS